MLVNKVSGEGIAGKDIKIPYMKCLWINRKTLIYKNFFN